MICDHAMIHRSTFYRYYTDKYVLLNSLLEEILDKMYQTLPEMESNMSMVTHILDYIEEHLAFLKHISPEDSNALNESLHQFTSKMLIQNSERHNDVLSKKIKGSKNPTLLSLFYSNGIREIFNIWVHDYSNQYKKEDMVNLILEVTK